MPTADRGRRRSRLRGVTFIELLVALAIVAILAAIAYPSYVEQVARTRQADAESQLMGEAQYLERYYLQFGCYDAGPDGTCGSGDDAAPTPGASSDHYSFSVTVPADGERFVLEATPNDTGRETLCFSSDEGLASGADCD